MNRECITCRHGDCDGCPRDEFPAPTETVLAGIAMLASVGVVLSIIYFGWIA